MKKIYIIFMGIIIGLTFNSCKKNNLLNQVPPTQLTDAAYWHTTSDLQNYVNNMYNFGDVFPHYQGYGQSGIYGVDVNSDNMVPAVPDVRLTGQATIPGNGTYANYTEIRDVNYFLANYSRVSASPNLVAPFVGEAYFFRAVLYFNALQAVGGVPYITKVLNINEQTAINAPRLPRNLLADSIISDLNKAIANLPSKANAQTQRVYKEYAEGMKARVCLYEGTWEKYHAGDVFGVSGQNGSTFLQQAADAADSVMNSHIFQLDNVGIPNGYYKLFNQTDYSSSKEVMFWAAFNQSEGIVNYWQDSYQLGSNGTYSGGLSKALVDDYLCVDGKPIATSPLYSGDDSLKHQFAHRDPRLHQTVFSYGDTVISNVPGANPITIYTYPGLLGSPVCTTGFDLKKGASTDFFQDSHHSVGSIDAVIYMRYAEILLTYAEAKAELGTLTQGDVDATINLLRDRVHMAHLNIGAITFDPNWQYPGLSPLINEVRRERRIELSCEGFRLNDVLRWAAAPAVIAGKQPLGAKVKQFLTVIPGLVVGTNVFVNPQGYIQPYQKQPVMANGYQFNINRDYLLPIKQQETVVNPAIKQNPGW